ncbi:hypothetical protein AOQ84DRAFT_182167 [Glonium stellatum]|uniref:Uncharacterized protein n=1 Tax=Glonium stellatum TaxID=574774 RepID=A0A8E2EPH5_9PEZI|nr:hypothetical protein AOQ84DRAFT_182167 [Glonium stellatum]
MRDDDNLSKPILPIPFREAAAHNSRTNHELHHLRLLDILDLDDRPTLILDLASAVGTDGVLQPAYCNPSLLASELLLNLIIGEIDVGIAGTLSIRPYSRFRQWLLKKFDDPDEATRGSLYMFEGFFWSATTVDKRWRIVSGLQSFLTPPKNFGGLSAHTSARPTQTLAENKDLGAENATYSEEDAPFRNAEGSGHIATDIAPDAVDEAIPREHFDCTLSTPPVEMSQHVQYFRSIDWAQTSLGPTSSWSPQLRSAVNAVMMDMHASVLFWGEDVVIIYNEAYIEVLGALHPCMGTSARVAFRDYWGHFEPIVQYNKATGRTMAVNDLPLFLDRHGYFEETFFSFQFIPILDEHGLVAGYHEPILETTKNKILERRVSSLMEVGAETAKARDLETYWSLVLDTLATNDKDIPLAILYSVEQNEAVPEISESFEPSRKCVLKGTLGLPFNHPIAPARLDLTSSSDGFIPYLRNAAKSRKPTLLHTDDTPFSHLFSDDIQWRGYGDPCKSLVVCPILPTTSENVLAFLIVGLNPRRPYDEDYQLFIQVMNRLFATSLASVVLFEEEIRHREKMIGQATKIQEQLSEQLLKSQREVELTEKKFQRFAERADIAIFIADMTGQYTYRNQRWFDIFTTAKNIEDIAEAWRLIAMPEDIEFCESVFAKLIMDKSPVTIELKTTMPWRPPQRLEDPKDSLTEHHVWILCSAYPEIGSDDEVKEIVGCVTDISRQKWAEGIQKQRTHHALESKRQLENFIDTTSHEMRNPLSAVMQCADDITTSYLTFTKSHPEVFGTYADLLNRGLDAAETITQCAQHMKRIVDDILTISKLDSGLLVITPVDSLPESVARHSVKMFEGEARAAGVDMRFVVEDSYRELDVEWASLDPTRLLQVLINLITNAIKFTRLESKRLITVSIGACKEKPEHSTEEIEYIRTRVASEDNKLREDWLRGEPIFLQFSVRDTGRGLSEDEKASLFARFSQGSPRTHIHYGGSGLGLFISRRLTEMQGGAVGFTSQPKIGSTFCFYVKARRSQPPLTETCPLDLFPDRRKVEVNYSNRSSVDEKAQPSLSPQALRSQSPDTLHVLVVEDNLVNQRVLAKQLRNLGCVVHVANHGGEALDFLQKTTHWNDAKSRVEGQELSVILMDWEMPVMDGLAAVKRIRQLQDDGTLKTHVPVIAVTANVRQQQIAMAIDAGMDDVVSKPFRVPELVGRMKALVGSLRP